MVLTEYLSKEALEELVDSFSCAGAFELEILSPDGEVLARSPKVHSDKDSSIDKEVEFIRFELPAEAEIFVGGEHVGTISLRGLWRTGRDSSSTSVGVKDSSDLALSAAERQIAISPTAWVELMRDVVVRLCDLSRQVRSRVEELSAMYRMTNTFTEKKDLKEIYQLVAETMVKVTGTDACSIRVFNEERTELVIMAAYGLSAKYISKGPILLSESKIDREVVETRKCVYVADERTDERVLYKAQARREGLVSALCVPMIYRGQIEGVHHHYTGDWIGDGCRGSLDCHRCCREGSFSRRSKNCL